MEKACYIYSNNTLLQKQIKNQLVDYLPIISGARMMKDYLQLIFGQK